MFACMRLGSGRLPGAVFTDGPFPWPGSEPAPPALGPDQLAVLVLLAPVSPGSAPFSTRYLRISRHRPDLCVCLLCRLVPYSHTVSVKWISEAAPEAHSFTFISNNRSKHDVLFWAKPRPVRSGPKYDLISTRTLKMDVLVTSYS